jgi:hypothetical protein
MLVAAAYRGSFLCSPCLREEHQVKRSTVLTLAVIGVALMLSSGVALAEVRLDQQQTLTDGGSVLLDDNMTDKLGQTFTAGQSGKLDKVSLYVGCCADASGNTGGTVPGQGLYVYVFPVDSSSGLPNESSSFYYGGVPAANFSTNGSLGWVDFPLSYYCYPTDTSCNGISAGKQYFIELFINRGYCGGGCSPSYSATGYQWGRTTPSAYSGGKAFIRDIATYTWKAQDQFDFAFKTYIDKDTTAPTVGSVAPINLATGVDRDRNVWADFSEAMDPSSVNSSAVTLANRDTGQKVDASVSYDAGSHRVTLDPSARLGKNTWYKVRIEGAGDTDNLAVKDLTGNELATDYTWTFKTGAT